MAPVIAISGLGQMALRPYLLWTGTAAALIAAIAFYDVWRMEGARLPQPAPRAIEPSPQLCVFLAAGFFIAPALVLAGVQERRRIAGYTSYFEIAWKLGVQLPFSGLFVGSTWLVLHLGAQLFLLIKLDFLSRAIDKSWLAIPVTTFAFACAMHLTDLRPAIVRGIRNLLLALHCGASRGAAPDAGPAGRCALADLAMLGPAHRESIWHCTSFISSGRSTIIPPARYATCACRRCRTAPPRSSCTCPAKAAT